MTPCLNPDCSEYYAGHIRHIVKGNAYDIVCALDDLIAFAQRHDLQFLHNRVPRYTFHGQSCDGAYTERIDGFYRNARERELNLPVWTAKTQFYVVDIQCHVCRGQQPERALTFKYALGDPRRALATAFA